MRKFLVPSRSGKTLADVPRVLGGSKTLQGVVASVIKTSIAAPMFGWARATGCLAGGAAMTGDLFSSFIEQRMGKRSSCSAPPEMESREAIKRLG